SSPSPGTTQILTAAATGTILNDDTGVSIAAISAAQLEGNSGPTPFTVVITRSGDTTGSTLVDYSLAGSGAPPANRAEFVGASRPTGRVTFSPGATSQTITINVNGDPTVEPDEGFTVALSSPGAAQVLSPGAAGTIRNDDQGTSISVAMTAAGDHDQVM